MQQEQAIEKATANFYAWEIRGRGWHTFDNPVELEPIYVPFFSYQEEAKRVVDDAKVPGLFSRISSLILKPEKAQTEFSYEEAIKRHYEILACDITNTFSLVGFVIAYPSGYKINPDSFQQLLIMLSGSLHSISFEIIGTSKDIIIQFTCSLPDALRLRSQLQVYCPEAIIREMNVEMSDFMRDDSMHSDIIELGLANEFTLPLQTYGKHSGETYRSFFGFLDHLIDNEKIILQILFKGVINPWSKSIIDSLTASDGKCFFLDAPEMLPWAKEKTSSPLFSVVARVYIQAHIYPRLQGLSREVLISICQQSESSSNFLMPMNNHSMSDTDMMQRQSNRLGMLLNTEELANFVHYPDSSVVSSKFNKKQIKSRAIPESLIGHAYSLGKNSHMDTTQTVSLDMAHRLRHVHIIGATGTGKSTLITTLINQDLQSNIGFALLDPHGDLVETVLGFIPEHRMYDVVVIDPSDTEFPIGLNLLEAKTEVEKIVLSSDLVTAFKRQSTSWGDQMTTILSNAINAFLESTTGGTLFDLRRFLIEDGFRNKFLKSVQDPTIIHFWQKEYAMLRKNAISPILVRLDTFLRPKIIRNMMAQKNGLNFNNLIAENKIILVKLPQGLIGEENSHLLGSLIVSKIQQAAQARQAIIQSHRNPFFLYLDEFQNFITPSMSSILSGSRKYGLGLILAHQDMEQVSKYDSELANSVLSNPATRICFRVGDIDARRLENGFNNFDTSDLQNLHVGQAIAKVDTASQDFNLITYPTTHVSESIQREIRGACIQLSRNVYAKPRKEVEEQIYAMYEISPSEEKEVPKTKEHILPVIEKPVPIEVESINSDEETLEQKSKEYLKQVKEREKITEHRYLQNLIKKMAESKGFKATIEEPIADGQGRVDIGLIKDTLKIAVEVSVTNTNNNESNNIRKCLYAGYNPVIMCSNNPKHLANIKATTLPLLGSLDLNNVLFYSPTELFEFIDTYNKSKQEKTIKGYRVKVRYTKE